MTLCQRSQSAPCPVSAAVSVPVVVNGGTGISTALGASNQIIITNTSSSVLGLETDDSNIAYPSAGIITVAGGSGIVTSSTGSTVTIASSFTWNNISTNTSMVPNNGYIITATMGTIQMTHESAAHIGDVIRVVSQGGALFQLIVGTFGGYLFGNNSLIYPTSNTITSNEMYDAIEITCVVAGPGSQWIVTSYSGTFTVT